MRTETRPWVTCAKMFRKDRTCCSEDMLADGQTNRQTDTLITVTVEYCTPPDRYPYRGRGDGVIKQLYRILAANQTADRIWSQLSVCRHYNLVYGHSTDCGVKSRYTLPVFTGHEWYRRRRAADSEQNFTSPCSACYTAVVNVTLLAFAAARRADRAHSSKPAAAECSRTDRRTYIVPLHRPCSAYYQ